MYKNIIQKTVNSYESDKSEFIEFVIQWSPRRLAMTSDKPRSLWNWSFNPASDLNSDIFNISCKARVFQASDIE